AGLCLAGYSKTGLFVFSAKWYERGPWAGHRRFRRTTSVLGLESSGCGAGVAGHYQEKRRMGRVLRLPTGFVAIAWLCALSNLGPPRLQAAERDGNVIETSDVASNGDVLLLPVVIGDREYRFMLDTMLP